VRAWGSGERRNGVLADITLATIHITAGQPDGARLAKKAIDGVGLLRVDPCSPALARTANRRTGSPDRQRLPGAGQDGPAGRHDPGVTSTLR